MRKLYDKVFLRTCRAYARHVIGDKRADRIYARLCAIHFWKFHGYWPCFEHPRTFSERVWHRMLYERDERFMMIQDKLLVRDYVKARVGEDYLIPLLWQGDHPDEIPFERFPSSFVAKASHGCGYNIIVRDKSELDIKEARSRLRSWVGENYALKSWTGSQWGYKNIKPRILVEALLGEGDELPADYKFFCFGGRAEFLLFITGRYTGGEAEALFDRDFRKLDLVRGKKPCREEVSRPKNLDELLAIADALSAEFDAMRVDLYAVGDRVYFGEMTPYPGGGCIKFQPREFDDLFGERWRMQSREC